MNSILTPVLLVVIVGLVLAVILTIASKVFFVPVDETVAALRAELPGANCGACGFAGCDDYAAALAENPDLGTGLCPVGGADCAAKLSAVLGVEADTSEPKVAVVLCNGNCDVTKPVSEWHGMQTCKAAKQFFGGNGACTHGCLGFGDCEAACGFDAIQVCNGVAVVNRDQCVACGVCAKTCPNGIISMLPKKALVHVQCSSTEKGKVVMQACKNGCIGCRKCAKACKFEAIEVENNLAKIDPDKCKNCGLCTKECPTGAIINMRVRKAPVKKPAAPAPAPEAPKAEA